MNPNDLPNPVGRSNDADNSSPGPRRFFIRKGELADIVYVDSLQKKHRDSVGFLPRTVLEKGLETHLFLIGFENGEPASYLFGRGSYYRNPADAIIYQACVQYDAQRRWLGTALVQAFLARLPPEAKRCSLWCAQDLEANLFWRALEFREVAYREGSRSRRRMHIFWQKQIRDGDKEKSLPVIPRQTCGGGMRSGRIVVPAGLDFNSARALPVPQAEVEPDYVEAAEPASRIVSIQPSPQVVRGSIVGGSVRKRKPR